jgi:hypothetical protein
MDTELCAEKRLEFLTFFGKLDRRATPTVDPRNLSQRQCNFGQPGKLNGTFKKFRDLAGLLALPQHIQRLVNAARPAW